MSDSTDAAAAGPDNSRQQQQQGQAAAGPEGYSLTAIIRLPDKRIKRTTGPPVVTDTDLFKGSGFAYS